MQNEEMTLRRFTALVAPMLEKNKLNAIGNGLIVTAMHDKEKNFKKWFAGKECTFVHPYTGNRIEIRIGRDIEAIYYFLRYCRMINTGRFDDQDFADYLAYLIARSNYYKMYFDMLKVILSPEDRYEIYIDIKDTHSYQKARKLREICSNSMYDFSQSVIQRLQPVRSDEIQIMQLVDILIGAIGYQNRIFSENFSKSKAKLDIIELIKKRSNYSLTKTTLLREEKCNLFVWNARDTL